LKAAYSLIPRVIKPNINPGETIEVEIFISGYGEIKRNKLQIYYSSKLINTDNPGFLESCIKVAKNKTGKTVQPVSGRKYVDKYECNPVGVCVILNEGNFMRIPYENNLNFGLPRIMAESKWDNISPIRLRLNTSPKAPSGNYDVSMILTYSDGSEIQKDEKNVKIHVKNWWERNLKTVTITGSIIIPVLAIILKFFIP